MRTIISAEVNFSHSDHQQHYAKAVLGTRAERGVTYITTGLAGEAEHVVVSGRPTKAAPPSCWNLGVTVAAHVMEWSPGRDTVSGLESLTDEESHMPGIAEIALAGAPIAGGALLGIAAGNLRPPDVRGIVKQDMDLLDRLPPEQTERRAELQRVIDRRIDDLIAAVDKNYSLREAAMNYAGNWRDIVVFICAILFTIVWWTAVKHDRPNFWVMFVVMIIASFAAGVYAARGIIRALRSIRHHRTAQ